MSAPLHATRGDDARASWRSGPPRWLAPALGLWVILAAVAIANATALPIHGRIVFALLAVLALGHGLIHRTWWVAAPATLVFAGLALLLGQVPGLTDSIVHAQGPAEDLAPRVIWVAALAVTSFDIGCALLVHRRVRRTADYDQTVELDQLVREQAVTERQIQEHLITLQDQVSQVERQLTTVP